MRLWQRGYVGLSFRHQDQYNNYEFRIRMGQRTNLTQYAQNLYVSYTSVSGATLPVVGAPNCVAHGYTYPGACAIDNNYNTWVTMQYGYKPHFLLDLMGWYQVTSIKVTNGLYAQQTLEVQMTDTTSNGESPKQCGIGNYFIAANQSLTLDCYNRSARYISVGTVDFTTLSIREIELFGPGQQHTRSSQSFGGRSLLPFCSLLLTSLLPRVVWLFVRVVAEISSGRMLLKRQGGTFTLLASDSVQVSQLLSVSQLTSPRLQRPLLTSGRGAHLSSPLCSLFFHCSATPPTR